MSATALKIFEADLSPWYWRSILPFHWAILWVYWNYSIVDLVSILASRDSLPRFCTTWSTTVYDRNMRVGSILSFTLAPWAVMSRYLPVLWPLGIRLNQLIWRWLLQETENGLSGCLSGKLYTWGWTLNSS